MANYIDGFVLPVPRLHLEEYKQAAKMVASIWKEHGALAYFEFVGEDLNLEGVRSFTECIDTNDQEVVVFGWVVFDSKKTRDLANKRVMEDSRMADLINPLTDPLKLVFDPTRMVYGGFEPLVNNP